MEVKTILEMRQQRVQLNGRNGLNTEGLGGLGRHLGCPPGGGRAEYPPSSKVHQRWSPFHSPVQALLALRESRIKRQILKVLQHFSLWEDSMMVMWRNKIRKVDDNISRWARPRCSSHSVQFSICWAEYNWRLLHSIPDWTWRHRIASQQNLTVSHINSWWHNIGKFLKRPILPPAPYYQYTATWRNHTTHHQTPNGPPIF